MFRYSLLFSVFALAALAESPNLRHSTILGPGFYPVAISADSAGNVYIAANVDTPNTMTNLAGTINTVSSTTFVRTGIPPGCRITPNVWATS